MTARAIQIEGTAGGTPVEVSFPAGGTTDVNIMEYLGAAVGPGNPVDVAVNGVVDTELPAAAAIADGIGNPTTPQIAADAMVWNGAGWDRVRGDTTAGERVSLGRASLLVAVSPAANAGATITLPAAGGGLFHFITHIYISRHATAALAGGGTLTITTTNLNGMTWRVGNQASITVAIMSPQPMIDSDFAHPIRSAVANTATTIVLPAPGAAVLWTAWCAYYTGPHV